jgi:hypothetical protein
MNTYTIIRDRYGSYEEPGEHCVLGVYLVEKQIPFSGWGYPPQAAVKQCPEDMRTMADVIRRYKVAPQRPDWAADHSDDVTVILLANNADVPLAILQEALEAVGIRADLIEGRSPGRPSTFDIAKWTEWPDVVPV